MLSYIAMLILILILILILFLILVWVYPVIATESGEKKVTPTPSQEHRTLRFDPSFVGCIQAQLQSRCLDVLSSGARRLQRLQSQHKLTSLCTTLLTATRLIAR